jgi:hypothetical protein
MLDLSHTKSFYEFKWFDGQALHLPLPTEELMRRISAADELKELEQITEIKNITHDLIKSNEEGVKFTKKELEQCDITICTMLLTDYMKEVESRLGEL